MRDGFKLKNEGSESGVGEEADGCMLQEVAESELCPLRRWSHAVRSHLLWERMVDRLDVGFYPSICS
jgi:hypothetical protein